MPDEPQELPIDLILFQAAEVAHYFDIELPLELVEAWLQASFCLKKPQ